MLTLTFKNRMKIRIVDIAKKAGVSAGTVDRIIHNRGKVSDKAYQKVHQAIKELGYEPDIMARNLALKKELHIVCLTPDPEGIKYWKRPIFGIQKAIENLASFKVKVTQITFPLKAEEFKNAYLKVIELQPDGVVYVPMFFKESIDFAKKLQENNIAFVHMNIHHPEAKPLSFIGQDAIAAGKVAASLCDLAIKDQEKILIISVSQIQQDYSHLNDRIEGFLSFFKDKKRNTDRIDHLKINIDRRNKEYETSILKHLTDNPEIRIIYVPNSRAYRIAKVLKTYNKKDIMLIGFDTLDENISFLEEGYINFIIAQQSMSQGYNAVMIIFNSLFKKEEVKTCNFLPIDILNQENIKFYEGLLD